MKLPLDKRIFRMYICALKSNTMSQSLSKLYVHLIFHVKNEHIFIRPEDEKELYAYIGEYLEFLREYGINFNENYLWE